MAKTDLGTKRIDPETGRKFYDLNRDPIVSPYTGKSYPRSYFDSTPISIVDDEEELEKKELDAEDDGPELVPLEDADEDDSKGSSDDVPDIDGDDDVDLDDDDDDDTFLPDEEEEDDDLDDIIGVGGEDDDEN